MTSCRIFALVALALTAVASVGAAAQGGAVVGARFVSCSGCRLTELPSVKRFFDTELPKYESVTVEYVAGHNPDVEFLDSRRNVVKRYDLGPMSEEQIHQLLQQHGIFPHSPAPVYEDVAAAMEPTDNCVAWRATAGCDPAGPRTPKADLSCTSELPHAVAGYCECRRGVSDAEVPCDHEEGLTCDDACEQMAEEGDL